MDGFFKWLSSDPVATTLLIVAFGVVVILVTVIYLMAFFQGRPISFWPPSVGAKPDKPSLVNKASQSIGPDDRIDEGLLASILYDLRDKSLPSNITDLVVERSITLQKCPYMRKGWKSEEIEFDHRNYHFRLPDELRGSYNEYFEKTYKKKFVIGGGDSDDTVMLRAKPLFTGTDRPRLRLETCLNLYSYSQFYWNVALNDPVRYNKAINDLLEQGEISFPHNLCMQLVVMTNDDKILLSLRSKDVGTYPNTWSCSIEENLKPHEDLKGDRRTIVARWISRALSEELGVKSDYCKEITVLSVFLEGTNRLNISMVGYVTLDLSQEELSKRIAMYLHPDAGEHKRHDYLTVKQMATELKSPTRLYHPTSRYRMLMALLHIYGAANFAKQYQGLMN
jgi:hypothetical protein